MNTEAPQSWQDDFGINKENYPNFFYNKNELNSSVTQSHVLRHAFNLLDLDGILCTENAPLIYFKQVDQITQEEVLHIHRKFWNHGGAPILVLITADQVHVYSGMSRPVPIEEVTNTPPSLVKTLERVTSGLQEFLTSVETGEFFKKHTRSFNTDQRVDKDLLNNLRDAREALNEQTQNDIDPNVLDALLCRMVFTCYLFDRKVIKEKYLTDLGIDNKQHLRDVLNTDPIQNAKSSLYKLFRKLGEDFNGDLFSDDLDAESEQITNDHIQILNDFFHGTHIRSGQISFWPYDFGSIPIETISAIYEHFLKSEDHQNGAFYTPRFLAEVVLDSALKNFGSLLNKRFFDPACGSGIFLVGIFNRIAEEWKQANPNARNDRRARELMQILQESLFGSDINPTACRITAFSLYLAYLDQLTPSDIQVLQKKGRALPHLVIKTVEHNGKMTSLSSGNIKCIDFFEETNDLPLDIDLVIGNPPWGKIAKDNTPAGQWCAKNKKPLPDKQIATAFIWKAAEHVATKGHICFVLPHGTLVNHGPKAIKFQKAWVSQHTIDSVLNLADLRQFLFNEAKHPCLVINYRKETPNLKTHHIKYWAPKADWTVTQAEIITISHLDRMEIPLSKLLHDLDGPDNAQLWGQNFWGSPRDIRFIDRISQYSRLRDHVRRSSEKNSDKPWVRAEGFQPQGENDHPEKMKSLTLPSNKFLKGKGGKKRGVDLVLLPSDCVSLESKTINLREKSNTNIEIYKPPHVLIPKGFQWIAFSDFAVSFRHSIRGIHGPKEDRDLLMFLAAYLRTPLAQYYAFHTSPNRSMFHEEVHVNELLRLPFPFPDQQPDKMRSREIVKKVASLIDAATEEFKDNFLMRDTAIENVTMEIEPLIEEYFNIQPLEKLLIQDTLNITIPSIQPSPSRMPVPTVKYSSNEQQKEYVKRVSGMLNQWAKNGEYIVRGDTTSSSELGIGMAVLEKIHKSIPSEPMIPTGNDLLKSLNQLRQVASREHGTIDLIRGVMVFEENRLYIIKPLGQRHWSQTAALNDADELAGTLLMHTFGADV